MKITDNFNMAMIPSVGATIDFIQISETIVRDLLSMGNIESSVESTENARLFTSILKYPIPHQIKNFSLMEGETLIIGMKTQPGEINWFQASIRRTPF
jgi:hypothetical protein